MSVTSNTELVAPSTGGRKIILTPNATADDAIVSGTNYISSISFDNSANAAEANHLKLYDNSDPTVGTTTPNFIFRANGGEKLHMVFLRNKPKVTTALSVCCVQGAGTAGTTGPTSTVNVSITTQTSEDAV